VTATATVTETVERVYRILAKRYHPDNQETGNPTRFAEIHRAYEVLANPVSRAGYDAKYDENRATTWKIFKQDGAAVRQVGFNTHYIPEDTVTCSHVVAPSPVTPPR